MGSKIYQVAVQRKTVAGAVQLNFSDADRANAAFATLGVLAERRVIADDFGCKINFDPGDIGHVIFADMEKGAEVNVVSQATQMLNQHRAQKRATEIAEKDVVIPRASLTFPPGTKFAAP